MAEMRVGDGEQDVRVERGVVGLVQAEQATVKLGGAAVVLAGSDATVSQGGAAIVAAKGDVNVTAGGASIILAAHDISVNAGGSQWLLARGDISVTNGGAAVVGAVSNVHVGNGGGLLVAGRQVHVEKGYVGLLAAPSATLGEGARVLLTPKLAAVFGGALGVGAGVGLTAVLVRTLAALWRRRFRPI